MKKNIFLLVLCIFFATTLYGGGWLSGIFNWFFSTHYTFEQTISQEHVLKKNGQLVVHGLAGTVSVIGWNEERIEVQAVKRAKQEEYLNKVEIDFNLTDKKAVIRTRPLEKKLKNTVVDYTIKVPKTVMMHINNNAGSVHIMHVAGSVDATVNAGSLSVSCDTLSRKSNINLTVNAGSIDLTLPEAVNATIDARSDVGSVNSAFNLTNKAGFPFISGNKQGVIGSGGAQVKLRANAGTIFINTK